MNEEQTPLRDKNYYKRITVVPTAPIFIATTVDIGTDRCRANHVDAALHYCREQAALKALNRPL